MKLTAAAARLLLATIPSTFAKLSSTQKHEDVAVQAGTHVIFSYPGLTPPSHLLDLTKQGKVGGIILFGENIDENVADVVQSFQDAYSQGPAYSGQPFFIMTDQEGGEVRRLPGGPEQSAKEMGQSANPMGAATEAGQTAASVLKAAKVNTNLAPVLAVYRTSDNFLDRAERSFSNDSSTVSVCASSFIRAQQAEGVVASAKHFPGMGAAGNENTDLEPVNIDIPLDEIRSIDEVPYKAAIEADVDMVMTAWAVYSSSPDTERPAGLSKFWIQDELRGRLGFKGVTVTDAIEAKSLQAFGDDANRGFLASQAGIDLVLASGRNVTQGEVIVDAIAGGLQDGSLDSQEFDKGTKRIETLRSKLTF